VLLPGAFLVLAVLASAQSSVSAAKTYTLVDTPSRTEPKLPAVDLKACPLSNRVDGEPDPIAEKIVKTEPMYSTWEDKRVVAGTLKVGESVTVWHGVNVIREPDKARVLQASQANDGLPALQPGDSVLGYGTRGDGSYIFWAKGAWSSSYYENVIAKGSWCGFADKSQCNIEIIENGIDEWWVQVRTVSGLTGWVRASKNVHGKSSLDANFGSMCSGD
jgi:hypothetical protein